MYAKLFYLVAVVILASTVQCQTVKSSGMSDMSSLPKHPFLLELSARPWLYELSQKYGSNISRLDQVPDAEVCLGYRCVSSFMSTFHDV